MGEKSIDDAEHSQRPSYCYTPYIDIELQFDPLQADPLLQKSLVFEDSDDDNGDNHIYHLETDAIFTDIDNNEYLNACGRRRHAVIPGFSMTTASNSLNYQHKRKLPLADLYSDATSDTSGRFDDADESDVMQQEQQPDPPQQQPGQTAVGEEKFEDTTSVHSAKRGRSNGWPFQNEIAYDENGMKIDLSARRSTPTPTPSKGMTERHRASPVLRIRRSRFIEGSMNDRVSEKPPSIYFPDDRNQNNEDVSQSATENKKTLEKRSSGIFRFGKAIASAFHPFGGSKASSKSEQDGVAKSQKEIMKQRQAKAEKAYAELKKSGYRGTNTIANANFKNQVDANIADETWKSIQEKIGYKLPDDTRISQDDTLVGIPGSKDDGLGPMSPEKGVSKLKSFSELRKRTSNLGIPAIRFRDVSPMSMRSSIERDEVDREKHTHQPMERRQSRKELHKQAKLLKRVSNLEDKLERARRELRGYVPGNDNQPTVPTICVDDDHDRQFGPGSLPTLLSERLLEAGYVQGGMQTGRSQRSTKWPPADSLSRKRKSPTPVTAERMHGSNNDLDEEDYDADCGKPSLQEEDDDKSQPESRLRNKLKSARDKRASSLTTKASQRLKAKQSSRNLRAEAKANNVTPKDEGGRHLQEQEGNTSSSSAQKNNRGWTHYGNGYENIPPVPPVPKELLNTTKSVSPEKKKHVSTTMKARIPSKEFAWPEDIF